MGSESVTFEGTVFPCTIPSPSSSKPLVLLGNGIYDTEIHFLQIKFYAIGLYAEPEITQHLQAFKGKPQSELLDEDSEFFSAFCKAPVEKFLKVVIIKEVKGTQYVTLLQSTVRDRLAYADKYEEEEEEVLDNLVEYFQKKSWFSKDTTIYYHWPSPKKVHISVSSDGTLPSKFEYTVDNENIVSGILDWICGEKSMSPSLLASVASNVSPLL